MKEKNNLLGRLHTFGLKLGLSYLFSGRITKGIARIFCPIHYTRYAELPIALEMLKPSSGERVLDISSPKILPIFYAAHYKSDVYTTDILDQPIEEASFFRKKLGLDNLYVQKEDARRLSFPDNYFDKVFSVSVFEHIAPAKKGEIPAIIEAARVLRQGGIVVLTLAFCRKYTEEYKQGAVYEREAKNTEKLFFQRFYDESALEENILKPSGMQLMEKIYIGEKVGVGCSGSVLAKFVDSGWLKTFIFGPFQKLLAACFLEVGDDTVKLKNPIIVCLKLKKV